MTEKNTLTVVINVFDDKYCDVYFFTSEQVELCSELIEKSFESFLIEPMYYILFNKKYDNPEKDLKSLVREHLSYQFSRTDGLNIQSYLDFPQTYSLEPIFSINDCVIDEVFICDYCIGNLYKPNSMTMYDRKPRIYRVNKAVCDIDLDHIFFLNEENLNDVISLVIKHKAILASFNDLSLYAIKDDRGIEVCPFSIGNRDYFIQKAREHVNNKNCLMHKTYVYEYKNGKTNKVYGCCKFNEDGDVIAFNYREDGSTQYCSDEVDKKYNALRADKFNLDVDNISFLSSYCTEVCLSCQKGVNEVKVKFYYNKITRNVFTSNVFNIGSKHKLCVSVFNNDLNKFEELLSLPICTLTKKSVYLTKKGIDEPLEIEITFEAE